MKKIFSIQILLFFGLIASAQPVGYYNGTSGLKGEELKTKLNEIIDDHIDFSYSQAKYLINYTDSDPANEDNVILFYTQRSQDADTYGVGGNFINREHVWAKSHGTFADIRPMDGDINNLRPADGSVNVSRSNKDFGVVQPNGTEHDEAEGCWYNNDYWEPSAATKGQVARILLYMATRYEGANGELDLEVVNGKDTYPNPEHGDLATLLEWNRTYPPSDFERRRANRIYSIQQNRNPFVDHPEWADLIWSDATLNSIQFDQFEMIPGIPVTGGNVTINFEVDTDLTLDALTVYWGNTYNSEVYSTTLSVESGEKSFSIPLNTFSEEEEVFYKVVAKSGEIETSSCGNFEIPRRIEPSDLTSIASIQGTGNSSSFDGKKVIIAGRVTAVLDNSFYMQSGNAENSGICVYGSLKVGNLGDSVLVAGEVTEYQNLTELSYVDYFYNFKDTKPVVPIEITANDISEKYEGMLVNIPNITFDNPGTEIPYDNGTSVKFSDGTASATIYSRYDSRLGGETLPEGVHNLVGVVSQYQDSYQILMHDFSGLSLGSDSEVPEVTSVKVVNATTIELLFNEIVSVESASDIENYNLSGGIEITQVYRYSSGKKVLLLVENMSIGDHTLTINNVEDLYGNKINNAEYAFHSDVTSTNKFATSTLKVYPNPAADGRFSVKNTSRIVSLKLSDMGGKILMQKKCNDFETSLNLNLRKGIYFLESFDEKHQRAITKLIVN